MLTVLLKCIYISTTSVGVKFVQPLKRARIFKMDLAVAVRSYDPLQSVCAISWSVYWIVGFKCRCRGFGSCQDASDDDA